MMQRRRPRQHPRRLQSGKKIVINEGRKIKSPVTTRFTTGDLVVGKKDTAQDGLQGVVIFTQDGRTGDIRLDTGEEIGVSFDNFTKGIGTFHNRDIKEIIISQAEGRTDEISKHQNVSFLTPFGTQAYIEKYIPRPKRGYYKIDVVVKTSDGKQNRWRYDHGFNDPGFVDQFNQWLRGGGYRYT